MDNGLDLQTDILRLHQKNQPMTASADESDLRKASMDLEASFIAEMLKSAGMGKTPESFGGGAGEDGFASFLVQAQAEEIVKAGGFNLAEQIFHALVRQGEPNDQ